MASSQDAWYLSLLGLAENFRTSSPPSIKSCIQCLQAVFYFKPPSRVEARTHLQLGNILLTHTKNIDLARSHLERAWQLSQTINQFDDVKFEAASVLAELYEQQQQTSLSQAILRKAVELSQHNVYWHCRLIFQLAQIHASQKDLSAAGGLLAVGADYSQISNANYTSILFLLSRCMLLLVEKKYSEALPLLNNAGQQIENWQGNQYQKEYLKIFYLVLQICHLTMLGQVKIVKQVYLKQFQQSIQMTMSPSWPTDDVVTGPHIGDMFLWMPKEHLHLISYLISTMNSMQNGYMEKAKKYSDTAFTMIENLKLQENKPILSVFQLMLLENLVMCQIVMGNRSIALSKIAQASELCRHQPKLFQSHKAQLHFLLGLYAMSMDRLEAAEAQLLSALNMGPEKELEIFINLNLAIVYIRAKREESLSRLMDRIDPESLSSNTLKAAAYFVQGLRAFLGPRSTDAKKYLRETLKISNPEDLARLTSGSLVLLGHIFLSLNNHKESMNVIAPALQIASKIPDVHIQVWATALLKDLSRICGDRNRENEAYTMHVGHSEALLKDQYQSSRMEEHALIEWIEGPIPNITRSNALASTSQPML